MTARQLRTTSVLYLLADHLDAVLAAGEDMLSLDTELRNADLEQDSEDAEDLLDHIQQQLRERRFARSVRLEVGADPDPRPGRLPP